MIQEVFINGERCVNLPGSDYYVNHTGAMFRVTQLVPYKGRDIYRVNRSGARRTYTKEQLRKLYEKFLS